MPPRGKRIMSAPTSVKERGRVSRASVGQMAITEAQARAAPAGHAASDHTVLCRLRTPRGD